MSWNLDVSGRKMNNKEIELYRDVTQSEVSQKLNTYLKKN